MGDQETSVPDGAILVLPWKKNDKAGRRAYTVHLKAPGSPSAAPPPSSGLASASANVSVSPSTSHDLVQHPPDEVAEEAEFETVEQESEPPTLRSPETYSNGGGIAVESNGQGRATDA